MKFHSVTQAFEQIAQTSSRTAITELLASLLQKADPEEARIIAYFSLGSLRPPYEGTQFSLSDRTIKKIVSEVADMSAIDFDEQMQKIGDLGVIAAQGSWTPTKALTVSEVYHALVDVEKVAGSGAQERRSALFIALLRAGTPADASVIIRIVLGKLRLGFSDMTLIDAFSWMLVGDKSLRTKIEHAYNLCADLGHIARLLKQHGIDGVTHPSIVVGIPIRPAAAERASSVAAVYEKLGNCVAQLKLDGFRLQIHIERTDGQLRIRFFSRNLLDMSAMFPDLVRALEAWVKLEHAIPIDTCIMEGEAIVYDEEAGRFMAFQETVKRRRKHDVAEAAHDMPLKLFVFDILYLNGTSLLAQGHQERRATLELLFKDVHSPAGGVKGHLGSFPIQLIEERSINSVEQLEAYFLEVIAEGLEGIVVKRIHAPYQPGKRNFNWIKLKRHEQNALDDTIDAVVLGYYYGQGKRAHFGIGSYLVGVYNKKHDRYETVAKVGTGLTDQEWRDLKALCDEYAVKGQPHNVLCQQGLYPDVWIEPHLVVVLRADEITRSPVHTAARGADAYGLALRFPRMIGYRRDKGASEATSVDELRALFALRANQTA